jgi:hypothetical protein
MNPPVVPYTPILRRYHEVCSLDDQSRYRLACELTEKPELLAADFRNSIDALDAGYNSSASFRPRPKWPRHPEPLGIANGPDLAWYMHRQQTLHVNADAKPSLDVNWVDYELSVLSTRGRAVFSEPTFGSAGAEPAPAGNPLKADLLLVNADPADRTPVLGEVKVKRDKEPFSALVQLLAYIAHVSTRSQYARLRSHFASARYPDTDRPRFDGYLLLYKFGESPNTWLGKLLAESELLSGRLMQQPEITAHIRRLVSLDVLLDKNDMLVATKRWLHPA